MKWFRWRGLLPFIILTALAAAFWLVLADGYAERAIERAGTELVGARVELDEADLSLFPLGLTLTGLRVTNPDEPMRNAIEASKIAFTIDGAWLLMRKVIIEEMTVEGVKPDTPRKTSGAVEKTARKTVEKKAERAGLKVASMKPPDVRKLLEKENLETLKLAASVEKRIESEKKAWESRLSELPGKEKLEEYRKRIESLKSTRGDLAGIMGSAAEVRALRKDILADIETIKKARRDFEAMAKSVRKQVRDAAQAPKRDFNRLRDKYGISPRGFANITEAILGPRVASYVRKALYWRGRLEPAFERARKMRREEPQAVKPPGAKGLDVHFREYDPKPDFLIRKALVSVSLDAGDMSGAVRDITAEQFITGRPTTFALSGEKLRGLESAGVEGVINRVNPDKPEDSLKLEIKGYAIRNATLSGSGDLPVTVREGLADLSVEAMFAGGKIDATAKGLLKNLKLEARAPAGGDEFIQVMADVLGDIKSIDLSARVTGPVGDYSLQIRSNLDTVLRDALARQARLQAGKWEAELRAAIAEKTGAPLKNLNKQVAGLDFVEKELSSRIGGFDSLLNGLTTPGSGGFKLPF